MDLEKLQYFPLALPHFSLLAVIFLVLVAWIEVQALRSAYLSMGWALMPLCFYCWRRWPAAI